MIKKRQVLRVNEKINKVGPAIVPGSILVSENVANGITVAELSVLRGLTGGYTFSLDDAGTDNAFVISGRNLNKNANPLDYSIRSSNTLLVRATNNVTNAFFTKALKIDFTDVVGYPTAALSSTSALQTSAAGTAPFAFSIIMGTDIYPGFVLRIQRATNPAKNGDGTYVTPTLDITHLLTTQERTDSYITQAALNTDGYTAPSGTFYEQYRWEREDGVVGPFTELTDTILVSVATLSPTNGVNKSQYIAVSAGNLTFTGTGGVGATCAVRATKGADDSEFQFEVTVGALGTNAIRFRMGVDDGTTGFNGAFPSPGASNSLGFCIHFSSSDIVAGWNSGANSQTLETSATAVQVGDIFHLGVNQTTGVIKLHRKRGGTTTQVGTNMNTGLAAAKLEYMWIGTLDTASGTVNFGATAFAYDDGTGIYG